MSLRFFAVLFCFYANAECLVKNSDGTRLSFKDDALFVLLKEAQVCPQNVQSLRLRLIEQAYLLKTTMVANRGRANPKQGSFSFFEEASSQHVESGELFFGHFSGAENGIIELLQTPFLNNLLVEVIAWDKTQQIFNFYELIGQGAGVQWFYRGNSLDALADNRYLYRDPPKDSPKFGGRMRCSACHLSGEPIMKELMFPNNDWQTTNRLLILEPNRPSFEFSDLLANVVDSSELSVGIINGIERLERSLIYQSAKQSLSLQEQLRPIFCETEINLESDLFPLEEMSYDTIQIPSAFFVNSFLATENIMLSKVAYGDLLKEFSLQFPETNQSDADHAWLVPVKGYSDSRAVYALVNRGVVDEKFVAAVYSIDLENPLLSEKRCALLKLLGDEISTNWKKEFLRNLEESPLPEAKELWQHLTIPMRTKGYFQAQAESYLKELAAKFHEQEVQKAYFQKLLRVREQVFHSEISQNPRGQILEPGFRVIFPISTSPL